MLLRLFIFTMLLTLPVSSWAAITYIDKTDSTDTKNVVSVTTSVTVAAGTDRALVFCSQARNSGSSLHSLSTVVRGAQSFTFVRKDIRTATDGPIQTETWVLAAPTTGAANVVATYAGVNSQALGNTITEWNGVNQTSPVDSHAGANGTGTAVAATITTVADNAAIVDCAMGRPDGGLTVGAGQDMKTDRLIGNIPTPLINDGAGVSIVATKTPAGAEIMNWTQAEGFQWAISALSLTPSGGSDPTPVTPGQVDIAWVNGQDLGNPSSGIVSTTIRRCTGAGCNACTAAGITTKIYPATTHRDTTVALDTTYGYALSHTDGVNLTSTCTTPVYVTTSSTPVAEAPRIASATSDATGSALTSGAVAPTQYRVAIFTHTGTISSVLYNWSSLVGGRHSQVWPATATGVCFYAVDAAGLQNNNGDDYQCDTLVGIVEEVDIIPPVLTCPSTINLPASGGSQSYTFSCDVDKPSTARYDTTDVAYASMTNQMSLNSLTFSATKTGLLDGTTTTLYVRGQTEGIIAEDVYPNLTSAVISIVIAAAPGDVTPPANVTGLAVVLLGNAAELTWNAAADAVSYQVYQATAGCTDYAPAGNPVGVTNIQFFLPFNSIVCWKVKAIDTVGNYSDAFSSVVTVTTLPGTDTEKPSNVKGLQARPYVNTAELDWEGGSDNSGLLSTNIEYCTVVTGQTDCVNFNVVVNTTLRPFLVPGLTGGVRYCFRAENTDGSGNVSEEYSPIICETTLTSGINAPRSKGTFGVSRESTSSRPSAGTRESGSRK